MWTLRVVLLAGVTAAAFAISGACAEEPLKIEFATQVGPSDTISSIAYSPDGKFAITSDDNIPKLWDLATGTLLRVFNGHSDKVRAVAFSPDGTRVVSGGEDRAIRLWDTASGKLLRTFEDTKLESVLFVAFSPNGTRILSGGSDKTAIVWDANTGLLLRRFAGNLSTPQSAAFSPDGTLIAVASSDGAGFPLNLWKVSTGDLVRSFAGHTGAIINAVAFSPGGDLVVSGAPDGTARLWDLKIGKLARVFETGGPIGGSEEPFRRIRTITFTHGGARVLAGCNDVLVGGSLIQWETSTGARLHTSVADKGLARLNVRGRPGGAFISAGALSPDGKTFLSGGAERRLKRWDVDTLTELSPVTDPAGEITAIAVSPNKLDLLSASADGTLKLWDLETGQLQRLWTPSGQDSPQASVAISPDGINFLSGSGLGQITLWSASTGARLREAYYAFKTGAPLGPSKLGLQGKVLSLAFSPDGRRIIAGISTDKGGFAGVWDKRTGNLLQTHTNAGTAAVFSQGMAGPLAAFSPDGAQFAVAGGNKVALHHGISGALLRNLDASTYPRSIAFSSDSRRLTSGAYVWDANTGALLRSFDNPSQITSGLFSPDGSEVATGDLAGAVKIWDVNTGSLLHNFESAAKINSVAFARGGRWILSGSDDGLVRIWDIATEQQLVSLLARPDGAWLAVTPEGFFAGSTEGADLLSVVRGLDVYGIDQFYQALYRPDLVREKLAGDPRGLVRAAVADLNLGKVIASGPAPNVSLSLSGRSGTISTSESQVSIDAEVAERGGGIGRLEWRVNGVTVGVDTAGGAAGSNLMLSRTVALDPGENDISLVAYNGANFVTSVPVHVRVTSSPSAPIAQPRLFVLAAGVADYVDKRIALGNPVADAREIARAFGLAGKLYQSVTVKLMVDNDVTSVKLDAAIKAMAEMARPSDVFVLYLAGHGKTIAGRYYFAPQDMVIDGELTDAKINASVIEKGISQDLLQRWFASVPARRSVILFDTCDSGTLTGDASETQQLERGAASDRLARATGRSIITASASSEEAQDGYRGHGLFTYHLLDAFYRGDSDNSQTIEISELAAYVYAKVTDISQRVFKQRQVPHMRITANYPLTTQVRVLKDDTDLAPVAQATSKYQVAQFSDLQVEPTPGAAVVRSLPAKTPVTVLQTTKGWSLITSGGKPIGYVATRDLIPVR